MNKTATGFILLLAVPAVFLSASVISLVSKWEQPTKSTLEKKEVLGEEAPPPEPKVSIYDDPLAGFSFSYPQNYSLDSKNPRQLKLTPSLGKGKILLEVTTFGVKNYKLTMETPELSASEALQLEKAKNLIADSFHFNNSSESADLRKRFQK